MLQYFCRILSIGFVLFTAPCFGSPDQPSSGRCRIFSSTSCSRAPSACHHMYAPPYVCTTICVHHHMYAPPYVCTTLYMHHHMYAPPYVCTTICMHHHMYAPSYVCTTIGMHHPMYAPPYVCTAIFMHHHMYAPPYVCTTLCMHHHIYAPPYVCTTLCMHHPMYAPPYVCTTLCMLGHTFPPGERPDAHPILHVQYTLLSPSLWLHARCHQSPCHTTSSHVFPEPCVATKTHQCDNFTSHRGVHGPFQCYQPAVHTHVTCLMSRFDIPVM